MKFKVITVPHTAFAAGILVDQLIKLGHEAEIVQGFDTKDETVHIIYQAAALPVLPKNYIIQQTEIHFSHWFNSRYLKALTNALAVWDYSGVNTRRYDRLTKKIAIVTPGLKKIETNGKDIEALFYGYTFGSERRKKALADMPQIKVVENTLGEPMWDILKRTKRVINIHYYDESPPELYRIYESISHGCEVWMHDEGEVFSGAHDNLDEVRTGLKVAGLWN